MPTPEQAYTAVSHIPQVGGASIYRARPTCGGVAIACEGFAKKVNWLMRRI